MEAEAESISTKLRIKCRILQESIAVKKKLDNEKKASLLYKRNTRNTNAQKIKV